MQAYLLVTAGLSFCLAVTLTYVVIEYLAAIRRNGPVYAEDLTRVVGPALAVLLFAGHFAWTVHLFGHQ